MNIYSGIMSYSLNRFLSFLQRTLLVSLLISLIWSLGLSTAPVLAMPNVAVTTPEEVVSSISNATTSSPSGDARLNAVISCLPKQLSEPSFKRAMSEMGNDQLERVFNLKPNPKLSQAEIELASCLSRKGFTNE
ncbi:MAG: hypothetical protein HC929_23260 [Leptolyngbyaceae cyanobacterium SM2_5_2]|nr:hypothetical protein [Leptolyngbyaceae cyanobacterium SM2_5_2]